MWYHIYCIIYVVLTLGYMTKVTLTRLQVWKSVFHKCLASRVVVRYNVHCGCKEVSFARTDNGIAGVGDRVCRWHIIYDPVKTFVSHFPLTEYRSNHDFRISFLISYLKVTKTQIWLKFVCINGYIHLLWMLGKCVLPPLGLTALQLLMLLVSLLLDVL